MTTNSKDASLAKRSAFLALAVSLGISAGQYARECLPEHGVCTLNNPTLWIVWAVTFLAVWGVIGGAFWALERHRQNHPGHETR